jgi:hypothetical protein
MLLWRENPQDEHTMDTTASLRGKNWLLHRTSILTPDYNTWLWSLNLESCDFFFNANIGGWSLTGSSRNVGHQLAYCTCPGWLWGWTIWWNDDWQGKPKYTEKTCTSAMLSTTNPTWSDRARSRAAAVGSQRLTAWAMARPILLRLYSTSRNLIQDHQENYIVITCFILMHCLFRPYCWIILRW